MEPVEKSPKNLQTSEPIRIPQTFRGIHPYMVYTWPGKKRLLQTIKNPKNLQTIKSPKNLQTSEPIRIPQTFRGIHPYMVYTWGHMSYNPSFFEGACLKKKNSSDHQKPAHQNFPNISGYTSLHGIHFETCGGTSPKLCHTVHYTCRHTHSPRLVLARVPGSCVTVVTCVPQGHDTYIPHTSRPSRRPWF